MIWTEERMSILTSRASKKEFKMIEETVTEDDDDNDDDDEFEESSSESDSHSE